MRVLLEVMYDFDLFFICFSRSFVQLVTMP